MRNVQNILFSVLAILLLTFSFTSCEKEFIPKGIDNAEEIVVEGYIEAVVDGGQPTPPYVILTKSVPFFQEIQGGIDDLFVRGAEVTVSDGENTYTLTELCWEDLAPAQQQQAAGIFGFDLDSFDLNFCVYIDLSLSLVPQEGKTYYLTVKAGDKTVTSQTTIPPHVPLDSLSFREPTGLTNDTMSEGRAFMSDPAGQADYYRFFTAVNGGNFTKSFQSVTDDRWFDGKANFQFVLQNPENVGQDANPDTWGLFNVGDTVSIKWCNLDKAHFDFWNTLEYNAQSGGPFSSYTRIQSNIVGGLGIWGGYSVSYYDVVVPPR